MASITLLNTVYKIGTGCIANRIKSFLNKLIHTDQSVFFKREIHIGENIRSFTYTEVNDIPGILHLIDFEKAYDSLSCLKCTSLNVDPENKYPQKPVPGILYLSSSRF